MFIVSSIEKNRQ